MKKTAVEWQHIELSKFLHGKSEFTDAHDILIKAKAMEKEQIVDAWGAGYDEEDRSTSNPFSYYSKTFNTNEK